MIGNVQTAEIIPNMRALEHTSETLPTKEQKEMSQISWPDCSESPEKDLTRLTPTSLQLELSVLILEHDLLEKWISESVLNGTLRIRRKQGKF